jgi:catechol 1,2-dioxygenase
MSSTVESVTAKLASLGNTNGYDPTLTPQVVNAMGPNTPPRARQVLSSLIRHLHDFARDVDLTWDEWFMGVKFLNSIGQASTNIRNEGHRISDILGLES